MSRFKIIQADPFQFKENILHFWEKYLPGTPPARLEWMAKNPAGPAIWLFAIEKKTGNLAGTISLFPKNLFVDSRKIKAAILGDFMIHHKFRVFGPAVELMKSAVACKEKGRFDFLYTIPNQQSKKLVERAGLKSIGRLYYMIYPHKCDFVLRKYIGSLPAAFFQVPFQCLMKICSRATYTRKSGNFEPLDSNSKSLDVFFAKLQNASQEIMSGDHSFAYIDWRYLKNPEYDFQVFVLKSPANNDILGLVAFAVNKDRLELYDIVALNTKALLGMLKTISTVCAQEGCKGIYITLFEKNPFLKIAKQCCFFDTKDKAEIYTYPGNINETARWAFTSADRNI